MPWYHLQQKLPQYHPRHIIEPPTNLHGTPWNPTPKPNPNPNLGGANIGVPWGLPYHFVGLRWSTVAVAAGVAMVPPGACHDTPLRRAMKSYATRWDAVGMPWYAMGVTMAMPCKIQIV